MALFVKQGRHNHCNSYIVHSLERISRQNRARTVHLYFSLNPIAFYTMLIWPKLFVFLRYFFSRKNLTQNDNQLMSIYFNWTLPLWSGFFPQVILIVIYSYLINSVVQHVDYTQLVGMPRTIVQHYTWQQLHATNQMIFIHRDMQIQCSHLFDERS